MATQRENFEPQTSCPTEALNGLLHHNRQKLLDRMIQTLRTDPGSHHPSITESAEREFANEIFEALLTATDPVTDNFLTIGDARNAEKPLLAHIAIQARNYRHMGTTLSIFLSVIKGMRNILRDFLTSSPFFVSRLYPAVSLIDRFFDALELEIIDGWQDSTGTPAEQRWRASSQALIDEVGTYQLAFSHSPIPILIVDAAALVVNMNPAAARFWQLVDNSTGNTLVETGRQVPWLNPELETFLGSPQEHYRFDKIVGHPALFIHVRVDCQRLTSVEGKNSGAVIIVHNTTESHRLEEALRAEREQFFQLLEQLPASVYLLSREKEIVFANREFRNNFGDIDLRSCFEAFHGLESQCPDCPALQVLETGQPVI